MAKNTLNQLAEQAQFLSDRLMELDWSQDKEGIERDFHGHIAPAHARLRDTLSVYEPSPGEEELRRQLKMADQNLYLVQSGQAEIVTINDQLRAKVKKMEREIAALRPTEGL